MPNRDIAVLGASAGGVEALKALVSTLPRNYDGSIFVVLHVAPRSSSFLPQILSNSGSLPASHAREGEAIERGRIYVAPPDRHLVLERNHMHLSLGPKENHQRPCINVTFRSAAAAFGDRVAGVVLSGQLDDGTAGLWDIKRQGGIAAVQHPEEAAFPSMPLSALRDIEIDYTLPIAEIGPLLARLAQEDTLETTAAGSMTMNPRLTDLTCPECRGTIWEVPRGPLSEYRCRAGHTYSARSMLMEHYTRQEKTLWQAIVALEEGASLARRLAPELQPEIRGLLAEEARCSNQQAATLRNLIDSRATFNLEE